MESINKYGFPEVDVPTYTCNRTHQVIRVYREDSRTKFEEDDRVIITSFIEFAPPTALPAAADDSIIAVCFARG
jgi:hypothetical protein